MRVAAVQLEARIADVAENLARCERLGDEAGARGAELIVLPEFFTTARGHAQARGRQRPYGRRGGSGRDPRRAIPRRVPPTDEVPDTFWMHDRGPVAAAMWSYQRVHGRRWYRRHARGRPPAEVGTPAHSARV